jgi:hypothetical protein
LELETAALAGAGKQTPMSVILLMPRTVAGIQHTIRCLQQQSVADQIELVIVGESEDELHRARQLASSWPETAASRGFAGVRVVSFPRLGSLAAGRAAGVLHSSGKVIAFAEDHCFPEPQWAEALMEAHQGNCDLVGPRMVCANPETALSWVCLALHFSGAAIPDSHGPADAVPSHNTAFKRDVLLDRKALSLADLPLTNDSETADKGYDELLSAVESAMEMEYLLQCRMGSLGFQAWQESRAVTRHINISRLGPAMKHALAGGWLYGAKRATQEKWGAGRKLFQILMTPLVIAVQVKRKLPVLRSLPQSHIPLWKLVVLSTLLIALHTLGEVRGLMQGLEDAVIRYSDFEHSRERFLTEKDQAILRGDVST